MEDVLELYRLPSDPQYPVVCMDEASKQLIGEVRIPLPVAEGQPARYDSEYERLGVCNQFMFVEPLAGCPPATAPGPPVQAHTQAPRDRLH